MDRWCAICKQGPGEKARYGRDFRGDKIVSSWVHSDCAARQAAVRARKAKANAARKAEAAGQLRSVKPS